MRHKWFPVVVLVAAVSWWLWHASYAQYHTLLHLIVPLVSAIAIALWFMFFGGGSRRVRRRIVVTFTVGLAMFFVAFRPVYNGDMGVYRWRLRFAKRADQSLKQLDNAGEASDWQTTPRDYPRFLGNGYWAEVKGVELETDWQTHPPRGIVAARNRRRLVGVCNRRRLRRYAGAARRERARHLLSAANGRACVDARRQSSLRSGRLRRRPRRHRPARDANDCWRSNLHARRHGHRQLSRRPHRPRDLDARHGR